MNTIDLNGEKCKISFDKISKRHYLHGKNLSTFGETLEEAIHKFKEKQLK